MKQVNFYIMAKPYAEFDQKDITDFEQKQLARAGEFSTYGDAYAKEHGTKGGTIGLVLSSSPLAWIGEKFQAWTDTTPSTKDIIDSVTLYWLTDTFPRCIYPYIDFFGRGGESTVFHGHPDYYVKKPSGYSWFPFELAPIPVAWAKTTADLIWFKRHDSGGHFAAMEKPEELVQDMEDFIKALDGGSKL
jgi:microsomal epoxide hydrolase